MNVFNTPSIEDLACHFRRTLLDSERCDKPFTHWRLKDVLPLEFCREIISLPIPPLVIEDCKGVRDVDNSLRTFFTPELRARFPVCDALARMLQRCDIARILAKTCDFEAEGSYIRAEYIQDIDGAWLEPHNDVPEKLFSMVVYLFTGPDAKNWGTDIYDKERRPIGKSPSTFNSGAIFIPGPDTWHGFDKRRIQGIRRLMEINYVHHSWQDKDQLAFPDTPVTLAEAGAA